MASKHQALKSQLAARSISKDFNSLNVFDFSNSNNFQQSNFWFLVYAFRLLNIYLSSLKSEQFFKKQLSWSSVNQIVPSSQEYFVLAKRLQLLSTQWLRYENYRLANLNKLANFGLSNSINSTRRRLNKAETFRKNRS